MQNQYILNVDLKRRLTADVPKFRRGDNGVLIFRIFDDGNEYSISSATRAEIYQRTPSGANLVAKCQFTMLDGKRVIRYNYEEIATVELGFNTVLLVLYEGDTAVSIQPFSVLIYDDLQGGQGSYVELIQDLMNILNSMDGELDKTIKLSEKGAPNGVATTDSIGKIPTSQIPSILIEHIDQKVYGNGVHGFRVNEDGVGQYETPEGNWENLGFSDTGTGGECNQEDLFVIADIEVVNGMAKITYKGNPKVNEQKYDTSDRSIDYFEKNGILLTENEFPVVDIGLYTLWYRDANEKVYTVLFNVTLYQLKEPDVNIDISDSTVTPIVDGDTILKKWDKGEHDVAYFQTNGTEFTTTFTVEDVGKYTIYYKLSDTREYVYIFEVTAENLKKPEMSITVEEGIVTVEDDVVWDKEITKWDMGILDIPYFRTSGNVYTGENFTVISAGTYTVYTKYVNGVEVVKVFTVSQQDLPDTDAPTIELTPSPTTWTNGNVVVSANIYDESGVASKKWAKGNKDVAYFATNGTNLTTNSFTVTDNGIYTVYAEDINGNKGVQVINITNMDKETPIITLSSSPSTSTNKDVTVNISITENQSGVAIKKWALGNQNIAYFQTVGTAVTGNSFSISSNNTYTVYVKDNAGNEAVKTIVISNIDKVIPVITLSQTPTSWTNSNVNITISTDKEASIILRKWASGNQNTSYFTTSGTAFSGTVFSVSTNNTYTVYAKDSAGNEVVKTIAISNIDKVAPTLVLSQAPSGNNVIITATASDNASGIYSITKPGSSIVYASSTTYTVSANGSYVFTARDNAGNTTSQSITVNGIIVNSEIKYNVSRDMVYKIKLDGTAYVNGSNSYAQNGTGSPAWSWDDDNSPQKIALEGITDILSEAGYIVYYLTKNGDIFISGANRGSAGSYIHTNLPNNSYPFPTRIPEANGAVKIFGDGRSFFYQTSNGDTYAMGSNHRGQLGLGYVTSSDNGYLPTPTKINTLPSRIIDVGTAYGSTFFLLANGRVYVVGSNSYGELGLGHSFSVVSPVLLSSVSDIRSISVGWGGNSPTVFYVTNSNQVYAMGANSMGQLGFGRINPSFYSTPTLNTALDGTLKVKVLGYTTLVLKTNNTVVGMGNPEELGAVAKNVFEYPSPIVVNTPKPIKDILGAENGTILLATDNTVYGLGDNMDNKFANGGLSYHNGVGELVNWKNF